MTLHVPETRAQDSRRLRIFAVKSEALGSMLTTGRTHRVLDGIPEGAELVSTWWDERYERLCLGVAHSSFEPVEPGGMAPVSTVEVQQHKPGERLP